MAYSLVRRKSQRDYVRQFVKTRYAKYLGVTKCGKCGLNGYASLFRTVNVKTGTVYGTIVLVKHQHTEQNKTVHDGHCVVPGSWRVGCCRIEKLPSAV